jgi:hypothetical protein
MTKIQGVLLLLIIFGIAAFFVNAALNPPKNITWVPVDFSQAVANNLIQANIRGFGLQEININLTSNTNDSLKITIRSGTIFNASSASVQDMVLLEDEVFYVEAQSEIQRYVNVACASMKLDSPNYSDKFTVSDNPTQEALVKLLNISNFSNETFRVQQFAIWTITDNPARDEYVRLVTHSSGTGSNYNNRQPYYGPFGPSGTGPSEEEINRIKALFENAGISTSKYKALNQAMPSPPD